MGPDPSFRSFRFIPIGQITTAFPRYEQFSLANQCAVEFICTRVQCMVYSFQLIFVNTEQVPD